MNLNNVIAVRSEKKIYRDGDRCVKVFGTSFSKADILNEALNQARIETTNLNVPKILEVCMIEGKWAIVSQFIPGKTLEQLMRENPEKRSGYLEFFVNLQLEVHRQSCPLLTNLRDKMKRKISQTDLDATVKYDLHTRLDGMPKHIKICHGDFNPSNIIISDVDGKPYIIDWSHVTQGNASADVARTYLLFCLEGENEEAEEYLDLFCRKSGTEKQYVQKWMPIVAASQSLKGNEHERAFLLRWATVTDYE
ncbi:MAG: phosphotransferase family protein [Sphaerochaeta sp.]